MKHQQIELFGTPSDTYQQIKQNLESYLSLYNMPVQIIEKNEIEDILNNNLSSIPAVKIADHTVIFDQSDIQSGLLSIKNILNEHVHGSCKTCTGCGCSKDKIENPKDKISDSN